MSDLDQPNAEQNIEGQSAIVSDLHDKVGNVLWTVIQYLDLAIPRITEEPARTYVLKAQEGVREAHQATRAILNDLRDEPIDKLPLIEIVRALVRKYGESIGAFQLELPDEAILFRQEVQREVRMIVDGVLNNIARHARNKQGSLSVRQSGDFFFITIEDTGRGFEQDQLGEKDSFGLSIIESRAEKISADLLITSEPGKGTIVKLFWVDTEGIAP